MQLKANDFLCLLAAHTGTVQDNDLRLMVTTQSFLNGCRLFPGLSLLYDWDYYIFWPAPISSAFTSQTAPEGVDAAVKSLNGVWKGENKASGKKDGWHRKKK